MVRVHVLVHTDIADEKKVVAWKEVELELAPHAMQPQKRGEIRRINPSCTIR